MPNVEHYALSYRFTEPDEQRFLEKMEQLESRLDDVEQQVLRIFSEVEISNSWLDEWTVEMIYSGACSRPSWLISNKSLMPVMMQAVAALRSPYRDWHVPLW